MTRATPEARAALWKRLAQLAGSIVDDETRAQYLAEWRRRFDAAFPPPPLGLSEDDMLPEGKGPSLADQSPQRRAALTRIAEAWIERRVASLVAPDDKALNAFAWGVARRIATGLIEPVAGKAAIRSVAGGGVTGKPDLLKSFRAGWRKRYDLTGDITDLDCAVRPLTDMGNAERFRARFGRDFLYTTAKGWLGYDGRRYRVLNQEKDVIPAEVLGAVFETVRAILGEARAIAATGVQSDDLLASDGAMDRLIIEGRKSELFSAKIAKWERTSESSGRLGCIANLAKRWLTVEITDFDTDPMLLNCHNGTLRFIRPDEDGPARVELLPHSRDHMLTKLAACDYDPDAPAEEFGKTLMWAQPKKERRRYLRQWLGYCLTGDMGEQIFHIWWGPTAANGKSTIGNAAREAAGDYGDITNVETFLDEGPKKRGDQATPDIVRLPGVRFLTSGEPGSGSKFNEPLINSVTGGDPMLARDNFRSFFRFAPCFKWTVWCNKKPDIVQGTEGIWRRAKVLLWESHLEEHQKDRTLPDRLKKEYAGILAWMVRGTLDWMQNGFVEPEDVTIQSAAYRDDSDPLASFLRMCTVEEEGARVQSSHLYRVFCAWAKAAGEAEWKQKGFSRAMKDRGFDNKQSNGMQWLGLRLIKEDYDFLDEKGEVRSDIDVDIGRNVPAPAPPGGSGPPSTAPPPAHGRSPPGEDDWPDDAPL